MMVTEYWQSELIGTGDRWGSLHGSNETASASVEPSVSGNGFYAAVPALTGQTNTVIAAIHDVPFFRSSALRCGVPLRTENTGLESGATPVCRALDPTPHSAVMNTIIGNQQSAIENRYSFQSREIDWSTGLYYFRARWYNPETGRWLSKDPIGISGGFNLYEAFGSNPVNLVDPSGLCEEDGDKKKGFPLWPIGKGKPPKNWPDPGPKWKWDKSRGQFKKGGRWRGWHEDDTHSGHWDQSDKNGNGHRPIYPGDPDFYEAGANANWGTVGAVGATVVGGVIIAFDIATVPSGEGALGVGLIKAAWGF